MTREEAIRIIKIVLVVAENFEITVQDEEFTKEKCKEAIETITKALSSSEEPCADAIRRQAVLEILNDAYFLKLDDGAALQESANQLPPVTPVEKVLDEIRSEIVHLHDWAFSRGEILRIIDKYKTESEANV